MTSIHIRNEETTQSDLSFAIAIPCFNEEQNIGELLTMLCSGWDSEYYPARIEIFSSECRDRTEEIIKSFSLTSPIPISLRSEPSRSGKCHAINELIEMAGDVDIIILISGDVQISTSHLIEMLKPFKEKNTGIVAGRPVPFCDTNNMAYKVSKVMWEIHHLMVLQSPKSTEVTVFRNIKFRLDENSLVDEAEIEWNVSKKGYLIKYCPSAIIRNKTPKTVIDYIRQRTRVTLGHCILKSKKKYTVGSMKGNVRINALLDYLKSKKPDYVAFCMLLILETWVSMSSKILALFRSDSDGRWDRIDSAKSRFRNHVKDR